MTITHRVAYLPEPRMSVITPAWLDWLKDTGYTGLYFEPDPAGPTRSGNISQFPTIYRLISLYDLAYGPQRERLRKWINDTCDLAHQRGLKVYLALWEPRIPAEAWGLFPVDWHGVGGWDRAPWNSISWCMSHPPAVAAFQEMARIAFASVPKLDGLKMGTHDNDAHLCSTTECPRCKGKPRAELVGRVFTAMIAAVDAAGLHRPDFEYVLYTWWWADDELDAVAQAVAGRKALVLGRSTQGLPQMWQAKELGKVFDLALGIDGISESFTRQLHAAQQRGWPMLDMTVFGHAIEFFFLPYTPAPNRVARRLQSLRQAGSAGWFDYDCGGIYPGINHEILRADFHSPAPHPDALVQRVIARLYPEQEQAQALHAYELAEAALACRPIGFDPPDVRILSGRNTIESVIALPFDPSDISGLDQGHRIAFFAPTNFFTPNTTPTLLAMYQHAHTLWRQACSQFEPLQGQGNWASEILPWEKKVFKAHMLATGSAQRYIQMASNRLNRGQGHMTPQAERAALRDILTDELAAAEEFAQLWRSDQRLLMNANIRIAAYLQACMPWVCIDQQDFFASKIEHTRRMLHTLHTSDQWDTTPSWKM